jgi:hypothetical protein
MAARILPAPITPRLHGLLDYGVSATDLLLPSLLGMSGRARAVFAAFGAAQGAVNALTVQPYAAAARVPFRVHGRIDLASLPVVLGLPPLLGLHREPRARALWLVLGAGLAAVWVLTDWQAPAPRR